MYLGPESTEIQLHHGTGIRHPALQLHSNSGNGNEINGTKLEETEQDRAERESESTP
jgi:hypothetical protein